MRRDLMDILACPVCKSPLLLDAEPEDNDEVVTGALRAPTAPRPTPSSMASPTCCRPR